MNPEPLHKPSGKGGLPKLLKQWSYIDVWPFTARSSLLPNAFVWVPHICMGKCGEFQTTSPLKPLGQCCSNFLGSLLGAGDLKLAKMVPWPRWPPCPYILKTFKNLLPQNQVSLCTNHQDGSSTEIAKMMVLRWRLTFSRQGQICYPIHLYGPYTFIWEKCCEVIFLTSPAWAIFTRFRIGPFVKMVLITCLNGSAPLSKMAAMPI